MINPLSIQFYQDILGKDINNWCEYQININGSHKKDAIRLKKKSYKNDRIYHKIYKIETAGIPHGRTILFAKSDARLV